MPPGHINRDDGGAFTLRAGPASGGEAPGGIDQAGQEKKIRINQGRDKEKPEEQLNEKAAPSGFTGEAVMAAVRADISL